MKQFTFFPIALLFVIWVAEPGRCSVRQQKFSEFVRGLKEKADPDLEAPPAASLNASIAKDRVFYPRAYGADPSGGEDSSDAILKALEDAFSVQNGLELLHGVNDLGGVVIDLQGGNYKISKPLRFPAAGGGNVVVKAGTLRASDTFPGDRHLVELWSPNSQKLFHPKTNSSSSSSSHLSQLTQQKSQIYYEDVTFQDILFDSGNRGGGLFAVDSARIRIDSCFFLHFTTQGILVQKGHETLIIATFLGQHSTVGGDPAEKDFSGTAIDISSNDNAVTDVVIFSAATGIILRGQANILTGVHCYNKATAFGGVGISIQLPGLSQTRIDNCYLDYTAIVMEDPVQVHVTNGFFLGDANIVLRSVKGQISGLNIVDNMFTGYAEDMYPIVQLEGKFTRIDQVVIDRNNVRGMSLKSTAGRMTVAGSGTKWVADFSKVLVFPNLISHFQYSFYAKGGVAGGFPAHVVTDLSNNTVVVESERAVDGLVSVAVDQHNMI
ncbi:polygalacturonase QRT3 [Malania oleifera]|uniref:polygalacturonase QRT3 n=1 Tax=Malania oleifera TaxID=397392 RepID=UPI0025AE4B9C|nr:polygalacturonase QRT3 [Malania oleifera]